jgi:threonine dehydrogenase-like Zn-dependent dehydrogenase
MRALVFDRNLEFRGDRPDPVAAPGESIVAVGVAGICGTDLEIAAATCNIAECRVMNSPAA